nr:hypothetical protein [Evansella caseinilytica]
MNKHEAMSCTSLRRCELSHRARWHLDRCQSNTGRGRDNGVKPMHSFQVGCEWGSQSQDGDIPPLLTNAT